MEQAHGFDRLSGGWGANWVSEQEGMASLDCENVLYMYSWSLQCPWIVGNCIEPGLWAGICWARVSCDGLGRQGR